MVVSFFIKSPAQRAADEAPPVPSTLTAQVDERVLQQTLTVRGTVQPAANVSVLPGISSSTAAIVTALPKPVGSTVALGDVVAQVSGRPIIALGGATPAYRNMTPGATGADVKQLQDALAALGYLPAVGADGVFGSATKTAVVALYKDRGFDPASTGDTDPGEASALQAARSAVATAKQALAEDQLSLEQSADATSSKQARLRISFDQTALHSAEQALAELDATTGVEVPLAEVAFVPSFPATVGGINSGVGSNLAGSTEALLSLSCGSLAVVATVPSGSQKGLAIGQEARIEDDINRRNATGMVESVGPFTAASNVDHKQAANGAVQAGSQSSASTAGYPVMVTPAAPLDANWLSRDVRLTIVLGQSDGPTLIVPVAAIKAGPKSTTFVTVLGEGGRLRDVMVRPGLVSAGEVSVQVTGQSNLKKGDRVVTG